MICPPEDGQITIPGTNWARCRVVLIQTNTLPLSETTVTEVGVTPVWNWTWQGESTMNMMWKIDQELLHSNTKSPQMEEGGECVLWKMSLIF